ncbi:hypothetical protein ACHWQZ_G012547 [Mnemiopsis leidyi]
MQLRAAALTLIVGLALADQCPESYPNVYYNGQYCCSSGREKFYAPQREKCDGSEIQRDSLCCQGGSIKCPTDNCDDYSAPDQCPESYPNVYYNGQYCCSSGREKFYAPQREKCDGSEIQRDSLCCQGGSIKCPTDNCDDYSAPDQCPESHPNVYYNGQYCCSSGREKFYAQQGEKCDGSWIQRDSLCCQGGSIKCPTDNCGDFSG